MSLFKRIVNITGSALIGIALTVPYLSIAAISSHYINELVSKFGYCCKGESSTVPYWFLLFGVIGIPIIFRLIDEVKKFSKVIRLPFVIPKDSDMKLQKTRNLIP